MVYHVLFDESRYTALIENIYTGTPARPAASAGFWRRQGREFANRVWAASIHRN
ncbi:MAG: hypothetical protein ACOYUZ_03395 [Patescibacteria group bacterium]